VRGADSLGSSCDLKARFFDLFTAGAEFGYPFPGGAVMDFSSADAMLTLLPQSGAPGAFSSSLTDPVSTSPGIFVPQVIALGGPGISGWRRRHVAFGKLSIS
jgi:hypothetical protein